MGLNSAPLNSVSAEQKPGASRKLFVCLFGLSLPLLLYYAWQVGLTLIDLGSHSFDYTDFDLILCGSRKYLLEGQSPYGTCGGNTPLLSGFLYPPLSILLLAPLALLPTALAFVVMLTLSVALLGAVVAALRNLAGAWWPTDQLGRWALPVLIVSLAPVMQTVVTGHINIVILATFVAALFFASRHRFGAAGLIVAIGFWLKLYPATLGVLFLSRQELRSAALWSAGCAIALALLGLMFIPLSLHMEYFISFLPTMQKFTVPGHSQSISAQIINMMRGDLFSLITLGDIDFVARPIPFSLNLLSSAVLVLGLGAAVVRMRRSELGTGEQLEALAILLLALLLYSSVAWSHHFVLAIPAVAILLMRLSKGVSRVEQGLIAGCWLALAVPGWTRFPRGLIALPGGFFCAGVFYLRYTLSALCMMGLLVLKSKCFCREVTKEGRELG